MSNDIETNYKSSLDCIIERENKEFLRPVVVQNRDKYYLDLNNIKRSWVYPFNDYCNLFIQEAEKQLFNALMLFELGYFDCAFYSLRSAVDISTTLVFLSDLPEEDREKYIDAWNKAKGFPIRSAMIEELSEKGRIFIDMLNKMPGFFKNAKKISTKLNKYVHKQGFNNFYIYINHPLRKFDTNNFIKIFCRYLEKCIGVVAVMRLAIDPFPLLLMDEEILFRCPYTAADPYTQNFAKEYIGEEMIEKYKTTNIYSTYYNALIKREKMNEALFDVAKHHYINSNKINTMLDYLHLVFESDAISILLVNASSKIVKVYCGNGIPFYFTDKNSKRITENICSETFAVFLKSENKINLKYDEAFISVLSFNNIPYFIEHNELLSKEEYKGIADHINSNLPKHFRDENA